MQHGSDTPTTLVPFTSTVLVASAERPAAGFSATQVKLGNVPGVEETNFSSVPETEKRPPLGKPPLKRHVTEQSTSMLQLTSQVNGVNIPG